MRNAALAAMLVVCSIAYCYAQAETIDDWHNPSQELMAKAAASGNMQSLKRFFEDGKIDVNKADIEGWTPLFFAAAGGHYDAVKFLLNKGARADIEGINAATPLALAILSGQAPVVKLLLQAGALPDTKSIPGRTVASLVELQGNREIIDLIETQPVQVNTYRLKLGNVDVEIEKINPVEYIVKQAVYLSDSPSTKAWSRRELQVGESILAVGRVKNLKLPWLKVAVNGETGGYVLDTLQLSPTKPDQTELVASRVVLDQLIHAEKTDFLPIRQQSRLIPYHKPLYETDTSLCNPLAPSWPANPEITFNEYGGKAWNYECVVSESVPKGAPDAVVAKHKERAWLMWLRTAALLGQNTPTSWKRMYSYRDGFRVFTVIYDDLSMGVLMFNSGQVTVRLLQLGRLR